MTGWIPLRELSNKGNFLHKCLQIQLNWLKTFSFSSDSPCFCYCWEYFV